MDRAIPKEEIRRRRIGLALRVGVAVAVVIGAVVWIVGRLQTGVKQKSLVFYTVDSGTIEMGVSAYGKVVPAFEERITSPVGSRVMEVYARPGDTVEVGTPLLRLDLQSIENDYKKLRDEDDIDEMIEKLAGKVEDPEKAMVVEEMAEGDCMQDGMAKDAALQILKKVRPAVCGISDKTQRARVVDALMASISSPGVMGDIQRASQSSAMRAADSARKTSYEKMCEESQSAYYARNPHKTQKEEM